MTATKGVTYAARSTRTSPPSTRSPRSSLMKRDTRAAEVPTRVVEANTQRLLRGDKPVPALGR
jgi:hypothetical protein